MIGGNGTAEAIWAVNEKSPEARREGRPLGKGDGLAKLIVQIQVGEITRVAELAEILQPIMNIKSNQINQSKLCNYPRASAFVKTYTYNIPPLALHHTCDPKRAQKNATATPAALVAALKTTPSAQAIGRPTVGSGST